VAEPALDTFTLPVQTSIGGVEAFPIQYPDARRDAPVSGWLWHRDLANDLESVFSSSPCSAPFAFEPQGEAVAFTPDGTGYYTLGEGEDQPIYFYGEPTAPLAPSSVAAVAQSSSRIRVTWDDESNNEEGFVLERSMDGTTFVEVVQLAPGTTSCTAVALAEPRRYLPPLSFIFSRTSSRLKLAAFCRCGKSLKVARNCATKSCAGTTR
jgi:hypothetical protein